MYLTRSRFSEILKPRVVRYEQIPGRNCEHTIFIDNVLRNDLICIFDVVYGIIYEDDMETSYLINLYKDNVEKYVNESSHEEELIKARKLRKSFGIK